MPNAKVSGVQHGAADRATMAKPCPSRRGVLNVRVSAANGLTALLAVTLHLDLKAQLDIARRLAATNAPILRRNFTQHDLDVVPGNAEPR